MGSTLTRPSHGVLRSWNACDMHHHHQSEFMTRTVVTECNECVCGGGGGGGMRPRIHRAGLIVNKIASASELSTATVTAPKARPRTTS